MARVSDEEIAQWVEADEPRMATPNYPLDLRDARTEIRNVRAKNSRLEAKLADQHHGCNRRRSELEAEVARLTARHERDRAEMFLLKDDVTKARQLAEESSQERETT